jgi:hypothetical protein
MRSSAYPVSGLRPTKNPRHLHPLQISNLHSAICIQKKPAVHTISTHPTPKPSTIRTVPLYSALFRQKLFHLHSDGVQPLGSPGQLPSNQNLPHAATHATPSNQRRFALRLLGERAGVRGFSIPAAQSLSALQRPLFRFVQLCSGLFSLNFFPEKSQPTRNVDADSIPPTRTRSVHTGTHWYTIKKIPRENSPVLCGSVPLSLNSSPR